VNTRANARSTFRPVKRRKGGRFPGLLSGITGPDIGRLQREGRLDADGRTVTVELVSEPRPGQRFAFVMDTRLCDAAFALADRADMLVCESTFANAEVVLARGLDRIPVPPRYAAAGR